MAALYIALGSGALLTLFCFLVRVEANAGRRIVLPGLRAALDRVVLRGGRFFSEFHPHVGSGAMRIMFHAGMQRMLNWLLAGNAAMRERLERWRKRNRALARSVREAREKSHLDLIAEHQAEQALDDDERAARKRRAIGEE